MIRQIADVSIYQDDVVWSRFYLVASTPSLRLGEDGRPVFLLTTYSFSADDRARDPSLPKGGGYLNLDTVLSVPGPQVEEIRAEMQAWVDEEHGRRLARGESSGAAPTVEFADPLLSGGTVRLTAPRSELLVDGIVGEAPASLTAGATGIFAMDLTQHGAALLEGLLVDDTGAGQVDLTPFSVTYDLRMWVRLPPVRITVSAKSERVHKILQQVSENNRDDPCTAAEVETLREKGTSSSTLTESGVVEVNMDDGNAGLPDEVKMELQKYALDLFDTMVKDRFLAPVPTDAPAETGLGEGDADRAADGAPSAVLFEHADFRGRSLRVSSSSSLGALERRVSSARLTSGTRITLYDGAGSTHHIARTTPRIGGGWNDRARSVRVWMPPTVRYRVREVVDEATMDLSITVERSSVVEWPVVAQATLKTFFTGMTAQEIAGHVAHVHLDHFQTLGVTVTVFADYSGPIRAVEVQCVYGATGDEPDPASGGPDDPHSDAWTFTETTTPALFDPLVVDGDREYLHRHRVIYDDGSTTEFTPWQADSGRALTIVVQDPGRLALEVSAAALNWSLVRSATVTLRHRADDGEVGRAHILELTSGQPSGLWEEQFTHALTGVVEMQVRYHLDDLVVDAETEVVPVTQNLVAVPPPQVDTLDVSFVPSGDWGDVAQVIVSARYVAPDGTVSDEVFTFTDVTQMSQWQVLLRDPTHRSFQYKVLVTYSTNAAPHETGWMTAEGDQAVAIGAFAPPKLRVQVLPTLVDFTRTPAVTVHLEYGDTAQTLAFVDATTQTFVAPERADGDRSYTYTTTYHPAAGGDAIVAGPRTSKETQLILPAVQLGALGTLRVAVRGFAVDFAVTPFVDVVLTWGEGTGQVREHIALSQAAPNAEWALDLGDRTQRTYRYQISYNLASGEVVEGPSGESDRPVLSIPPLPTAPPAEP